MSTKYLCEDIEPRMTWRNDLGTIEIKPGPLIFSAQILTQKIKKQIES